MVTYCWNYKDWGDREMRHLLHDMELLFDHYSVVAI